MKPPRSGSGPLRLVEDAAELCAQDLNAYLFQVGAGLSFAALLAWSWLFCSRSPQAIQVSGLIGLACTLAFIVLKQVQARYAHGLARRLGLGFGPVQAWGRWRNQTAWQCCSVLALPVAALTLALYTPVSAFFQNLAILDDGHSSPGELAGRAWKLSRHEIMQLHLAQLFLGLAGAAAFANIVIAVFMLFALGHSVLGLNSAMTRNPWGAMNTTFFFLCLGAAWATIQPLAKAMHALRAVEASSRTEGADLARRLQDLGLKEPLV